MEAEAGTGGLKATAERRFPAAAAAGGRGPGTLASQGRRRTPPAMPYGASLLLLLLLPWGSHCATDADGPSPCPARREASAEGMGQTCQRTCTQDRDCSGRRQCLCDGACGLSCVIPGDLAPSSFCSPPPETDNGFHSGASYRAGGEVRYKCKRGYRLEGPETIRCQENQEWSGPTPTCHPRCVVPAQRSRVLYQGRKLWIQEIPEGRVQHGEIVTFYCRSQNQTQSCSYPAPSHCFDGLLPLPACYDEPTWLQYKLFPKRVVSEIRPC
ncbi:beta-2-glycoprotein 1-like isoform X2 [Lepidochelys kempii]|uniref:beta-2-glycoprotein 1-like isoform X2 n=1 Tax=Lepidochelys kempii TaxID=8472 RepID=UPI003C6EE44A